MTEWKEKVGNTERQGGYRTPYERVYDEYAKLTPTQAALILKRFKGWCENQNVPYPTAEHEPAGMLFPGISALLENMQVLSQNGVPAPGIIPHAEEILSQYKALGLDPNMQDAVVGLYTVSQHTFKAAAAKAMLPNGRE